MIEPRKFVDEGYEIVDASTPFEEEAQPHYTAEAFYPARNGEIIHERYQLTAKVGYGTSSTVWTAQDLQCVPVAKRTAVSVCPLCPIVSR